MAERVLSLSPSDGHPAAAPTLAGQKLILLDNPFQFEAVSVVRPRVKLKPASL